MRIVVNALSCTNLSGPSVLLGHIGTVAAWTRNTHEFTILHHAANRHIHRDLGPNVHWQKCAAGTRHWLGRTLWESVALPGVLSALRADVLFSASGSTVGTVAIPQFTLAMNPWALIPDALFTVADRLKARLQRTAYRRAMRQARGITFISQFMKDAYGANAGVARCVDPVVYCGMEPDVIAASREIPTPVARKNQIVCASLMARHKDVETVVKALAVLERRHGLRPGLVLLGGWADSSYCQHIERTVESLGISDRVTFTGHVSREEMFVAFRESRAFCLMSRCESFGIPSVEAQCFGTPVVAARCCAAPEICGDGGLYPPPGDAEAAAEALALLLTNDAEWLIRSEAAIANAAKYRYESCSKPLLAVFESVEH